MKKALLIGINYRNTDMELRGCINDVEKVQEYLLKNGYSKNNITIITDDTRVKPTRKNIIQAFLDILLTHAERIYIHYSGHGIWVKDMNGDEEDGRDEAIVPLDCNKSGLITDDQLRGLLTFMSPNTKLTAVFDCCHSGTGLDLKYNLIQADNFIREGRKFVNNKKWIIKEDTKAFITPGEVYLISGCQDHQTSTDDYISGDYQGALTFYLLQILNNPENKPNTWKDLLENLRKLLSEKHYDQIAQLSSGKILTIDQSLDFC